MKRNLKWTIGAAIVAGLFAFAGGNVFGLGSDHSDGQPVTASNWPDGMASLVNGWKNGIMTNYLLEVHFWTEGRIALDEVVILKNVTVGNENQGLKI